MPDNYRQGSLKPAVLLYIDIVPAVRIWSGAANFALNAASGPDTAGGVYQGLGLLVSLPNLVIPLNGSFSQHTFSISGVSDEAVRLFDADRAQLRGADLSLALISLDAASMPLEAPDWIWSGVIDSPFMRRDGDAKPATRTIGFKASTGSVTRKQQVISYYTAPHQRALDPDDAACDQVAGYAAGTTTIFPN